MDRRDFLRSGLLGTAALLLGACRGKARSPLPAGLPPALRDLVTGDLAGATYGLEVFPGGLELLAGRRQRFPFGLTDRAGTTLTPDRARVWVAAGAGPATATYERYGSAVAAGDPRGFLVTTLTWPAAPGIVDVLAAATTGNAERYGWTTIETLPRALAPDAGQPAVAARTPTVDDPSGVASLCTRRPPCPLHERTLANVLADRRPVVFTIASPLLCTSRTCGPVLEEVLRVRAHAGPRARFVHAEPYAGATATALSPAARAWRIESEPWTFVIDGAGVVRARFEGPVVSREILAALQPLL